jgi:glycosyltransferase involved in cell wall biosynthesis
MNGYDDEPVAPARDRDRFIVAYLGWIYLDRDPRPLLQAARRVVAARRLEPHEFRVEFMGPSTHYNGVPIETIAAEEGVAAYTSLHRPRPRAEALEFLARASVLVSLPQDIHDAIPSKLFEYMNFDAWILALAAPGSATEALLRSTPADVVPPNDTALLADRLGRRYDQYARGIRPKRLADSVALSRRAQAAKYLDYVEAITGTIRSADT